MPRFGSRCLPLVLTLFGVLSAQGAENLPLPETQQHEFVSRYTGRRYQLRVGLPRYYDPTRQDYTVVYQLDAQWDFFRVWAITRALEYDGRLAPMIVCGITYGGADPNYGQLRQRDYTPTPALGQGESGEANLFLQTVANEIVPLMETRYACRRGERILMGSSYGGLFTGYALLNDGGLFTGYVLSSPSMWFDNEVMVQRAQQWSGASAQRGIKVRIITGASENYTQRIGAQDFYNALQGLNLPGLDLGLDFEPSERHGAVAEMAYLEGLPQVVQAQLVPLKRGDPAPRNWTPSEPKVDWWVDQVWRSTDARTGARRRLVLNDPVAPARSTYAAGVIYVMDGQWGDFRAVDGHFGSLLYDYETSSSILRAGLDWEAPSNRVLMQWREQAFDLETGGGAADTRAWVRDEVIPQVEGPLNSPAGYRMIVASEKAAAWALADLLSEEPSFDRYLLVSPDVGAADRPLWQLEATRAARGGDLSARVMIYSGGDESLSEIRQPLADFVARLRSRNYANLTLQTTTLDGRGYAQAKIEGYHKGLRQMIR